jgi:hypothetical protein
MSAQKLAIFVGRMLSFYKVGIIGLAKTTRDHNTQNTTQKTKNTQTNMIHCRPTLQQLCPLSP